MPHPKIRANRKKTPSGKRKNPVTPENWKVYLQWLANGGTRQEAAVAASLSVQTVRAHCITEPSAMTEIRAAEREWIRRDWPIERIDEFLVQVASGKTNVDAAKALEMMDGELNQLMTIILHDPSIREMYDEARKLQCETWADEMIEISDQTQGDHFVDDQGRLRVDHDSVNRAKLKIGTRQWLMSRLHHERFGDKLTQKHEGELTVNHHDVLDMARKRKEAAQQKAEQMRDNAMREDQGEPRVH